MAQRQLFLNGTILDVVGGTSQVGNLVVEGGLITEVTTADIAFDEDDTVYDCTGQTLSPGLIDCHVHLHYKDVMDVFTIELSRSIEEATIDAVYHAGKLLDYGFTTIREVGTRMAITPRVRDAVNAGMIRGPRIFSCGQIITVRGGLADHNPDHLFRDHPYLHAMSMIVTGPWEARNAVRIQAKNGVDYVKCDVSGTGFSPYAPTDRTTMSPEELEAIVTEARAKEMAIAVHAESAKSICMAARAGVTSVEHGVRMDEEGRDLMLENGVTLVPTLSFFMETMERGAEIGLAPTMVEAHTRDHELHRKSVQMAYDAGIPIVSGGDAGLRHFPQGSCVKEPVRYLEVTSMTPMDALRTITINGAVLTGLDGITGSLDVGKSADLVVYATSPLEDMGVLGDSERRLAVFKQGVHEAGTGLVAHARVPSAA